MTEPPWYSANGDVIKVCVRVQPGASRRAMLKHSDGRLKLRLTAAPSDGKANRQATEMLAGLFHVAHSRVELRAGAASQDKIFLVHIEPGRGTLPDPLALPTDRARL